MALKVYKPTTPARRRTSVDACDDVTTNKPYKPLLVARKKKAGRSHGSIVCRHKGGGHKRHIRVIDTRMDTLDVPATVKTIEYDPNRNARVSLLSFANGKKTYIIIPDGLNVGDSIVFSKEKVEIKNGNRTCLKNIPVGVPISNVELKPGAGAILARSAGSSIALMGVEGKFAQLKMPSGEIRLVSKECMATIGQISNSDFRNIRIGKAGRKRHMGIRPTVRGKVMNPCDHPHGGGEARNSIGMKHPKTPWGKPALGVKTRGRKKASNKYILKRRKK